jgi:VIT1/CCC1 family predicted Fe2+/Mn2+ transporter
MHNAQTDHGLRAGHQAEQIRARVKDTGREDYMGDAVLGAVDGSITTFAVVAGAIGGGFSNIVIIVLGLAKLIADGISMAVSNYLRARVAGERIAAARKMEHRHIDLVPEGEREEVRIIFANKGLSGENLDAVVDAITQDRELWVDTMLQEELNLPTRAPHPLRAAGFTFLAFVLVGFIPLAPFLLLNLGFEDVFVVSGALTMLAFFGVGALRGRSMGGSSLRAGFETLLTGGAAAGSAYGIGRLLQGFVGGSG